MLLPNRPLSWAARPSLLTCCVAVLAMACSDDDKSVSAGSLEAVIESCDVGDGIAPVDVTCVGGFSGAPDDSQVDYAWNFGDAEGDEVLVGRRPTHRYRDPGEYTVTLTVTLADGTATGETTERITIVGAANLSVTGVTFAPTDLNSGEDLTASFGVKNTGSATAPNSQACVLLGRNKPVTVNTGILLGFLDAPGLDGNGEAQVEGALTVPPTVDTGSYFVAACADCNDDIDEGEAGEGDNCAESEQPALTVTRRDQFADLTASDIVPTPSQPFVGGETTVCYVAENVGERPVFGFQVSAWAVAGEDASAVDLLAGGDGVFELNAEEVEVIRPEDSERRCLDVDLPDDMAAGAYRVFVHLDPADVVVELSEDNNIVRGEVLLRVEERVVDGVDLLPCSLDAEPHQVASDGNLQISACVCNRGRIRAIQHTYEFKLSPDLSFDHEDAATLGVCNIGELPAQQCRTCSFQGNMAAVLEPGTLGQFFVCGRTDASMAIRETVEGNNDICDPEPITVGESTDVDLTVSEVSFGPVAEEAFLCGRDLDYSVTVENRAPTIASAFKVGLYLSPDDSIERTDFLLDMIDVPQLQGSRALIGQVNIPIDVPKQVGSWFFGVLVDPDRTVVETDEGNNRAISAERLVLDGCRGGCSDDGFEPNDGVGSAARIGVGTHEGLCVGPESGDDWYGLPLLAGESLSVTIGFDQVAGDLDLELYDASGANLLDRSATGSNQETVRVALAASPALYFVRVRPARADVESDYSMTVEVNPPLQGSDLTAGALQTSPRNAIVGQEIEVQLDVLNLGLQAVEAAFEVQISARNLGEFERDPNDPACADAGGEGEGEGEADLGDCGFLIGPDGNPVHVQYAVASVEVADVRALGSSRVNTQVVIPPAAGEGLFAIVVDIDSEEVIAEVDEDNNRAVGQPIEHRVPPQSCLDNEDAFEPNNGPATAQSPPDVPTPNGPRAVTQDLTVCEDFDDWWTYELEAGDELICDVTFAHALGDIELYLVDPAGEIHDSSTTREPREEVSVSGAQAGTWMLHVNFFGGGGEDPWNIYRMRCELNRCASDAADEAGGNDTCLEASALTADGVDGASLCTNDVDWYCIDLFAGFPATICAEPASGAASDLQLTLLRECEDFVQNRAGCVTVTPRIDGEHCVKVEERNGRIKAYELTVEGLDGADVSVTDLVVDPAQIMAGVRPQVTATLRNTLVQDVGSFTYEIRLSDDDEVDDGDAVLRTWRSEGGLPRGETLVVDTKVDLPADLVPGDWFIGVRIVPDPETVDRSQGNNQAVVPVEVLAPCAPDARDPDDNVAPGLGAPLGEHQGSLCAGDTDWYAVEVGVGEDFTATLTFEHDDGDLDLYVYAWDGLHVGDRLGVSDGSSDREEVTLLIPGAGTYLVQVVAPRAAENSYTLVLTSD